MRQCCDLPTIPYYSTSWSGERYWLSYRTLYENYSKINLSHCIPLNLRTVPWINCWHVIFIFRIADIGNDTLLSMTHLFISSLFCEKWYNGILLLISPVTNVFCFMCLSITRQTWICLTKYFLIRQPKLCSKGHLINISLLWLI